MAEITVYSKPDCQRCDFAKRYLIDNNIPFSEINVLEDSKALTLLRDAGYSQMPVVDINGEKHTGFKPDILAKIGEVQ